ncbi:hypothetical protein FA95DRAFT_1559552 [Auriscalpium vulgare]|uniref:Uncharacterized protein n=1 Tax=Auriscalpium vulgare TaxID=40419 RepID=A0ACB8RSK0_9AGAM|nr:hypothetical protein FA95DRAFT_1559552 [Auriscalpium vulgare]
MSSAAWLDTSVSSEESFFFIPSGNICTDSSADTLDINTIPTLDHHAALIKESLTLQSLCSSDFDPGRNVPKMPDRATKRAARCTLVSLTTSLAIPKNGRRRRKHGTVLVSSPTPERLEQIPQLRPALDAWVSATAYKDPPGLVPWCPTIEGSVSVWIAEGSFFPPCYVNQRLLERHGVRQPDFPLAADDTAHPQEARNASHRRIRRRASFNPAASIHREAVVVEAAGHLTALIKSKPRRWSLSVPASYMGLEIKERNLEIQRLEACLRGDLEAIDTNVAILGQEINTLNVPEIRVSTSTTTVPFSVLSAPSTPGAPVPLAVRRGQKVPPALALRPARPPEIDSYPGIPTAFLGSPADLSPDISLATGAKATPHDLMVSRLRSQVADMKPHTPRDERTHEELAPMTPKTPTSAGAMSTKSVKSEDEWAFAKDLMSRYGEEVTTKTPARRARPAARTSIGSGLQTPASKPPKARPRASMPAAVPVSTAKGPRKLSPAAWDVYAPAKGKPQTKDSAPPQSSLSRATARAVSTPKSAPRSRRAATTPARSTPTPARHARPPLPLAPDTPASMQDPVPKRDPVTPCIKPTPPSAMPALPNKIHGILKRTKSVRFASPPGRGDASEPAEVPATLPQTAGKGDEAPSVPKPSPLRESITAHDTRPPTPASVTPKPRPRKSIAGAHPAREARTPAHERRSSYQPQRREGEAIAPAPPTTCHPCPSAPLVPESASTPASPPSPAKTPRARKSLLFFADKGADKENNKPAGSPFRLSLATATPRRRKDENAARRDSDATPQETPGPGGTGRSRLSTPLKSIFGRLRA